VLFALVAMTVEGETPSHPTAERMNKSQCCSGRTCRPAVHSDVIEACIICYEVVGFKTPKSYGLKIK